MTKVDVVRAEMVKAMKAGDKERKNALSMLLSALKNATIDKRSDLTEEEADVIVRKEIKQTQETLDTTPAERTEIIEECKFRIAVNEEFVPKMMEADAIEAVIKETLAELGIDAPTVKDKGKIMKVLMPKCHTRGFVLAFASSSSVAPTPSIMLVSAFVHLLNFS